MSNTINAPAREFFNPKTNGFTFPNRWTLDDTTCQDVHRKLVGTVEDVYALLAPLPDIASLRNKVRDTLMRWINTASVPALGLCGGMAFASLDFYKAHCPIRDTSRKAEEISPDLRIYIVQRMIDSLAGPNLARVLAWMFVEQMVPWSIGKRLLLRWTRAECETLKTRIQENDAWPIALIGENIDPCTNHQVLALKCEGNTDHCDIYVYDVNYPGDSRKLSLSLKGSSLELEDDGIKDSWKPLRGLFCEEYSPAKPPLG